MFLSSKAGAKMSSKYSEIGRKRLGAVITQSYKIQGINDRDIQDITKTVWQVGINKDSSVSLRKGHRDPKEGTLIRIAPLLFKPRYFQLVNDQLIGTPVFYYQGADYDYSTSNAVKLLRSIADLPDQEYRCTVADLVAILKEETPTKKVFSEAKKQLQLR